MSFENLKSSFELWNIVKEVSYRVATFVKNLCRILGLDQSVDVVVSLNDFNELLIETRSGNSSGKEIVCGYYEPRDKLIVLSLPCIIKGSFSETLAHELIHHCQYTCRQGHCKNLCEVLLSIEEGKRVGIAMPYGIRPHEVEAYSKQKELAKKLEELEDYREVENLIRRLYSTRSLSLNFDEIGKDIKSSMESPTYSFFSYALSTYARNFGADTLTRVLRQHVEKYYGMLAEEVRECFEREAEDLLNLVGAGKRGSQVGIVEGLALALSKLYPINPVEILKKSNVKFITLTPCRDGLDIYIVTSHGYALRINTHSEYPPLASLEIKFSNAKAVSLYKIIDGNKVVVETLLGTAQIRISGNEIAKAKVILKRDIDAVGRVRKLCKKLDKPLHIKGLDLIALLCFLGFVLHNAQSLKFEKLDDSVIRIQYATNTKSRELFVCSNTVVYVDSEIRKEISVSEALEKIIARDKSFFDEFIINPLFSGALKNTVLGCVVAEKAPAIGTGVKELPLT